MAKKDLKSILLTVGVVLAIGLSSGALIRQVSKEKTKELASYSYTIGVVDEDGKLDKDEKGAITSEELQVKDLVSIEIDEDAEVMVTVHWYDEDGTLLSSAEVDGDTPTAPEGAETFRVEIEPTEDEDGEVSALEKGGYAKLVTVTLKK